jgi:hypothetical protein
MGYDAQMDLTLVPSGSEGYLGSPMRPTLAARLRAKKQHSSLQRKAKLAPIGAKSKKATPKRIA